MKDKIIKTTEFYKTYSKWIERHKFDEFGRPLTENEEYYKGSLSNGYPKLAIKDNNGNYHRVTIHRLVATLFIPNPNNMSIINHINGNKLDYRVTNLEWTTTLENNLHAIENNLKKQAYKPVITTNYKTGEIKYFKSIKECAEYFGVKRTTISTNIRRGNRILKLWDVKFFNDYDNNRLSVNELNALIDNGEVIEHPIHKNYYGNIVKGQIISTKVGLPKILKLFSETNNHLYCMVENKKHIVLHRFIVECKIGRKLKNTEHIEHIDSDFNNNSINNLRISNVGEIIKRKHNKKVLVTFKNNSKKSFNSQKECSEYFGVTPTTIHDWIIGRRKCSNVHSILKIVSI